MSARPSSSWWEPLARTFAALGHPRGRRDRPDPLRPGDHGGLRDGQRIRFPASTDGIVDALRAISAEDARNWSRYAAYCSDLYDMLLDTVYLEPVSTVGDLARALRRRPALARFLPGFLTSYQALLSRFFSDRAQQFSPFRR